MRSFKSILSKAIMWYVSNVFVPVVWTHSRQTASLCREDIHTYIYTFLYRVISTYLVLLYSTFVFCNIRVRHLPNLGLPEKEYYFRKEKVLLNVNNGFEVNNIRKNIKDMEIFYLKSFLSSCNFNCNKHVRDM